LRKQFRVEVALGGEEGLEAIEERGPYAVVVSDMRMPGMDGVRFLSKVREKSPQSVRMMLTGHSDTQTAIQAINEGNIFRFLTKPCPPDVLTQALGAGLEQFRLVTAEKELLEGTLNGSVKVLVDVLSLVNPTAFGRAARVERLVRRLCAELEVEGAWQVEIGAMLSQLGCVTVPEDILMKVYRGKDLTTQETRMFQAHPQVGRDLIINIPRLEVTAEIIAYQEKRFDGSGVPEDKIRGEEIPLGARILKLALDFDTLTMSGTDSRKAFAIVGRRGGWYDVRVVEALERVLGKAEEVKYEIKSLAADEFGPNMILAENVETVTGALVMAKGQEVTRWAQLRLKNFAANVGIQEPIKVLVPLGAKSEP